MEKTFLYRWTHISTGTTGTRERKFLSEKSFLACLDYWNSYSDWKYCSVSEPDPNDHTVEKDKVYAGPFEFYGI